MFFSISSFLLFYVWALDVCFVVTLGFVMCFADSAALCQRRSSASSTPFLLPFTLCIRHLNKVAVVFFFPLKIFMV